MGEHNCKINPTGDKTLLSSNGNLEMFDVLLRKVEKKKLSIDEKLVVMGQGLVSYTETYFYSAQTTNHTQGCDGKTTSNPVNPINGKHFKIDRIQKKAFKLLKKISRKMVHEV